MKYEHQLTQLGISIFYRLNILKMLKVRMLVTFLHHSTVRQLIVWMLDDLAGNMNAAETLFRLVHSILCGKSIEKMHFLLLTPARFD